ncbi:MAG TPA: hypothetical protein PLJ42_01155 [Chitinophagales bacterium]|jgi:hypothetical protein|nr:hypothetical protein [Chitinophagales bacterium]MBP6154566.1 hypothetical protein [Chitinophagales bacterium]HQV76923.1 hypothetical protein [Chitinophagales bacterium]HQW78010.1 hypothetical protein [Chitinophagales bacterium]
MKKTIFILAISILLFSCKKENNSDGNLDQFKLTATFDGGETITFKQFDPDDSDAGLLSCGCFFDGDNMTIGFGATNFANPSKTNGFDVGINVPNVTAQRNYESREENAAGTNATTYIERIATGIGGIKVYNNVENYRRFSIGGGSCDEEELPVDFQTIDVTRYSSSNGGTIEGSFTINVYHKPSNNCANYEKERITGSFKLKRINF